MEYDSSFGRPHSTIVSNNLSKHLLKPTGLLSAFLMALLTRNSPPKWSSERQHSSTESSVDLFVFDRFFKDRMNL